MGMTKQSGKSTRTLLFSAESNQYYLLDSCQAYVRLASEELPLPRLFTFYLAVHEPRVFMSSFVEPIHANEAFGWVKGLQKRQFFEKILPLVSRVA